MNKYLKHVMARADADIHAERRGQVCKISPAVSGRWKLSIIDPAYSPSNQPRLFLTGDELEAMYAALGALFGAAPSNGN